MYNQGHGDLKYDHARSHHSYDQVGKKVRVLTAALNWFRPSLFYRESWEDRQKLRAFLKVPTLLIAGKKDGFIHFDSMEIDENPTLTELG